MNTPSFFRSFQAIPPVRVNMRVGLLGGSFNPAHEGHVHIAKEAMNRLKLDAVWWMVSPHNPLKTHKDMAQLNSRILSAWLATRDHQSFHVTAFETNLARKRTADVLRYLVNKMPKVHFVWLMGQDNWHTIHHWGKWPLIFETMPVAVLPRTIKPIPEKPVAESVFKQYVQEFGHNSSFALSSPPAIGFIKCPAIDISSTEIRARRQRL